MEQEHKAAWRPNSRRRWHELKGVIEEVKLTATSRGMSYEAAAAVLDAEMKGAGRSFAQFVKDTLPSLRKTRQQQQQQPAAAAAAAAVAAAQVAAAAAATAAATAADAVAQVAHAAAAAATS
jgi:hypothetical protein